MKRILFERESGNLIHKLILTSHGGGYYIPRYERRYLLQEEDFLQKIKDILPPEEGYPFDLTDDNFSPIRGDNLMGALEQRCCSYSCPHCGSWHYARNRYFYEWNHSACSPRPISREVSIPSNRGKPSDLIGAE